MLKILPSSLTGWRVEGAYGEWPFMFPNKGDAISFFLVWAEKHQPCDVQIYNYAGDLERNITFPADNHRQASGSGRRQMQSDVPFPNRRRAQRRRRD
jgi:hypothetical protein